MAEFKDVIHMFSKYCSETLRSEKRCENCRFRYNGNKMYAACIDYLAAYPEESEEFLSEWANGVVCNLCGKQLDEYDIQENFGFDYRVGYGSKYDLEHVKARFCCGCFDKMLDELKGKCAVSPILGEYKLADEKEINGELVSTS